jgi:hypothetical protein
MSWPEHTVYGLAAIRCWYVAMIEMNVVSVIVPIFFLSFCYKHHSDNTTGIRLTTRQGFACNVRCDSIAGAKIKGLWVGLVG